MVAWLFRVMMILACYSQECITSAGAFNYGFFKTKDNLSLRKVNVPAEGKSRGTIIFMEGMGGFIEGYTGIMSMLSDHGFDVHAFDPRGQGASQRITLKDSLLHIESFDDYVHDLHSFIHHERKLKRPLIFLGISMGGHVALRYAYEHPDMVDALVLLSPMVEINTGAYPRPVARTIATVMSTLGAGESFVLGYDTFSFKSCLDTFDPRKYGDPEKHIQDCKMLHERPHLAVGGPSFSWLYSAFQSCDKLKAPDIGDKLNMPVMLIAVENDHLVETDSQLELCKILPNCRHFLYTGPDVHHNLLKDRDDIIERVFTDIKKFIVELPKELSTAEQKFKPQTQLVMDAN